MAGDRLTSSDKRALTLWIVAGVLCALFAYKYYFQAFPEASVNFQISRVEAQKRARDFITGLGENVDGYRTTIVFEVDENAKTYLERELGLQEANRLMASTVSIWSWNVRIFKALQQEEFHVYLNGAGQVVGYEHHVEEERKGSSLDEAAAQEIAQNFTATKLGQDLHAWELLPEEANSKKRMNRIDWKFTWERRGFRAKDAPYRLVVAVQGDRIGGATQSLKVPEAWERSFAQLRSGNDTLALVFVVPYILVLVLAVWLGLRLSMRGQATWRTAVVLGVFVTGLLFLQSVNGWPLWSAKYDTDTSYESFILLQLASALGLAAVTALTITLVLPAGEALYRASQPKQIQLYKMFTLRGLRSKEFFSATVVGLSMAAVHIGYVVAFYVVASWLGAWAPQELRYEESVNTAFPWISGAAIGLLASTNEEFTFRLFAIPFLKRVTGSRWIAVIVPAFLWSFLHSNYPQEPAYIRGIEIGLFGILAGLVMLRWGILATLIWHYTVDALLVGLFLIRSNSPYFKVSGVLVAAAAVAPLMFAGISYLVQGRFEPDEDLLNSANPVAGDVLERPVKAGVSSAAHGYRALAPAMIAVLLLCVLGGGAAMWRLRLPAIGGYLRLTSNAKTAKANADAVLRQHGLEPGSFYHSTVFIDNTDSMVNEYLRERIGVAAVNAIYATHVPGALWRVRYFKDSQPEEFAVVLRPDGTLHSFRHQLAEARPGASLSKEEAVARAEKFLHDEKHIDVAKWALVDSDSEKRPHRLDHTLTWQENAAIDGAATGSPSNASDHAYARIELQVLGDEVANYRTYVKIPEEWRRANEKLTLGRMLLSFGIKGVVYAGLGLFALVTFLRNLRSEQARRIPWRRFLWWGAWGLAAYLVSFALSGSRVLNLYQTTVPFKFMLGTVGIGAVLGGAFYFGAIVLLFGLAYYFALLAFGENELPSWSGMPATYYRDALLIGLGSSAGIIGLSRLVKAVAAHWPTAHRSIEATFGSVFDTLLPGFFAFAGAMQTGLLLTGAVCLAAAFVAACVRPVWLRSGLFVLGAAALVGSNWGTLADFARQFVGQAILLAALIFGVRWVMRFNLLGGFLTIATMTIVAAAADLMAQPDEFYRANAYAALAGLAVLLAWPLFAWRRASLGVS